MSKLLDSARHFIHAILAKFNNAQSVKDAADQIIEKGYLIAEIFAEKKVPEELANDAQSFLHSLLQGQHVINLTDEQLHELVDQAIALAEKLHEKKE